jgi:hypothetical protein
LGARTVTTGFTFADSAGEREAENSAVAAATVAVAPATQPTLDAELAAAQEQARRANADFRAARQAALDRLAQRPEYQQARAAWQESEARVKQLRQRNDAAALAAASQEWMARKSAYNKVVSAGLDGDPNLRAAAGRVAETANRMTQLQQQLAAREDAERQQQEAAARTARAVDSALSELAARARNNVQFLIERGVIDSVDAASGEVRVDPLVWQSMTPQTRDAVALMVRQSQQLAREDAATTRPTPFRIVSNRDEEELLATYPAAGPATTQSSAAGA